MKNNGHKPAGLKLQHTLDPISKKKEQELAGKGPRKAEDSPFLHVGRPNIGDRQRLMERINDIIDRRWLTNGGPYVGEFEQRIAELTETKHCISICNGTIALEIAIRALELTGEVIVPSFTFVATAHALQWQQITPVFCDIDPATYTIDPARIEQLITPKTTGIIGVHTYGRPCDVEALSEIAQRRGLKLLFDSAHAFGCSHNDQMVGRFGDAEIFSFHATKFLNSFEGGAIVTNNDALADKIRLMKNFGFKGTDNVEHVGTNGKMIEVAAAMGLTSLESMDEFIAVNYRNYKGYQQALENIPGLRLLAYDETQRCNYQYIVLEVDETLTGLSRDELISALVVENVLARRYFYPGCHRMEPYKSLFPNAGLLLQQTEAMAERVMLLPTGTAIESGTISRICSIMKDAIDNAPAVRQQFKLAACA